MPIVGLAEGDGAEGGDNSQSNSHGPGGIYHEKQVGALCGLHSVNNLLQGPHYTVDDLRSVAQELDNLEREVMNGASLDFGNACADGFYNVQVIHVVLSRAGIEMVPLRELPEQKKTWFRTSDLVKEKGFVLNKHRHWFAMRRLGKEWFDLNSCLPAPHHFTQGDLVSHIAEAMGEGYAVFVVRGVFPACTLEKEPKKLKEAVKGCKELQIEEWGSEGHPLKRHPWILLIITHFFGAAQFDSFAPQARQVYQNFLRRTFAGMRKKKLETWGRGKTAVTPSSEEKDAQPSQAEKPKPRVEKLKRQWPPAFVLVQCLLCLILCITAVALGEDSTLGKAYGLESFVDGKTLLVVHIDCKDFRKEAWRLISYQFTHGGVTDVLAACVLTLAAGISLEGFWGPLWTPAFFNSGILGGALCHMVAHPHSPGLRGMSPGAYALVGAHLADLVVNFDMRRWGKIKMLVLLNLLCLDQLFRWFEGRELDEQASWAVGAAAQGGGALVGFLFAVAVSPNTMGPKGEWFVLAAALLFLAVLASAGGVWVAQWPPRALRYPDPWCWARQVSNHTLFGDPNWHCVRCLTERCIQRWSSQGQINPVDFNACNSRYGWNSMGGY